MTKTFRAFLKICLGLVVFIMECIKAPIFLMTHPGIFKNEFIYIFYHWSFGHEVTELDYISRLYFPYRVSVIYLPSQGTNPYLPVCFRHSIDTFEYPFSLGKFAAFVTTVGCGVVRFFLLLISAFSPKVHVIDRPMIYRTLSIAHGKLSVGREEKGIVEQDDDYSGYFRLLDAAIGKSPALPEEFISRCKKAITQAVPHFFERPFVLLLLREKGMGGEFSNAFRSCGSQQNYREAVQYLTEHNYSVVGSGETNHEVFRDIPGYFSLSDANLPPGLLNVFLLTQCRLFIGQMSGAYILPSSCGILCLITDALSHRLGAAGQQNIMLYKHLRERTTGKILSLAEIYKEHKDLAFGYHFKEKNIEILPNTPEEILLSVQECLGILEGNLRFSEEDKRLIEEFRKLPSEGMHLKFLGNRTSLHILRKMKAQNLL